MIGSSCIGASVLGGVCNNSGALVRRGPAYTEMALYARVNESGELERINHLGDLGNTAEEILTRLQKQDYKMGQVTTPKLLSWHQTIVTRMTLNKSMQTVLLDLMPIRHDLYDIGVSG